MSDALANRVRALALAIRRLQCQLWTDPERFFRDRSELAVEADAIANQIAPDGKQARRVGVDMKRGGVQKAETMVINGRRVTVQRRRHAFAISVGK